MVLHNNIWGNTSVAIIEEMHHTAALDPQTAAKVLKITDELVHEGNITTLMITHNMKDAISHGNRLIMMNNGQIILDVSGEEKKNPMIKDVLKNLFDQGVTKEEILEELDAMLREDLK